MYIDIYIYSYSYSHSYIVIHPSSTGRRGVGCTLLPLPVCCRTTSPVTCYLASVPRLVHSPTNLHHFVMQGLLPPVVVLGCGFSPLPACSFVIICEDL